MTGAYVHSGLFKRSKLGKLFFELLKLLSEFERILEFMSRGRKRLRKNPRPREEVNPRFDRIFWLIPCLAALWIFARVVRFDFIFDDHTLIELNPQVHSWDHLPRLLTTHLWSHRANETIVPQYRPMFSVWLLTLYSLGGP